MKKQHLFFGFLACCLLAACGEKEEKKKEYPTMKSFVPQEESTNDQKDGQSEDSLQQDDTFKEEDDLSPENTTSDHQSLQEEFEENFSNQKNALTSTDSHETDALAKQKMASSQDASKNPDKKTSAHTPPQGEPQNMPEEEDFGAQKNHAESGDMEGENDASSGLKKMHQGTHSPQKTTKQTSQELSKAQQ